MASFMNMCMDTQHKGDNDDDDDYDDNNNNNNDNDYINKRQQFNTEGGKWPRNNNNIQKNSLLRTIGTVNLRSMSEAL